MREVGQIGLYMVVLVCFVGTLWLFFYVVRNIRGTGNFSTSEAIASAGILVQIILAIWAINVAQTPIGNGTGSGTGQTTGEGSGPEIPRMKSVDYWRNTQYSSDCQGIAAQSFTVDVKDGEGLGPRDITYEDGYSIYVQDVASGNLNGDGGPEAAVLLQCSPQPSNSFVQEVQVFTGSTDGPHQLGELPELDPLAFGRDLPPKFDSDAFFIDSGQLVTGVDYYALSDSQSRGPSIRHTLYWEWDGQQFVVTDRIVSG